VVAFFAKGGETFDMVIVDLDLTVLANLCLAIVVGVAEHDAGSKWKETM